MRAVLELASSSRETCFLVGNEVVSPEEDAPFIGVDPDKRQRSLGMVDVIVDGASVYPEIKAGFLDGVVPVGSYCYRCVLQVGHNQLFYAVKLRRKAQHGNSSSGRLSGILGDFVGFCDTPFKRSDKHSSIFHPRKALSVGLHQKNAFCSFRRYSWGGDKLARVTTGWKGLKPLSNPPVYQYLSFL